MASNEYHFITQWSVRGTLREVSDILGDAMALPRWWPSVYLAVREVAPGDPQTGLGREIDLYTKGWLPYTLRWWFRVVEAHPPDGFAIEAHGDFEGRGAWTFEQRGDWVEITYDWRIAADKPLLRYLSWLMKPIFAANHRWAMAQGEQSLKLELARRRAETDEERALIPAPPPPTRRLPFVLAGGGALALMAVAFAGVAFVRRR
ncbi:MAG TPA: hypothetical protein VF116_12155 [Ktedonobacterales bacterium]